MQINASSIQPLEQTKPIAAKFEKPVEPKQTKVEFERPEKASEDRSEKIEDFEKLKSALEENNISLKFSEDSETKQLVVKLVDSRTGEAIRQMPSEISLKLAADFVKMQGQFIDQKQ